LITRVFRNTGLGLHGQHPSSLTDLFYKTPGTQPFRSGFTQPLGNNQQAF
jgi:hypothetical protein